MSLQPSALGIFSFNKSGTEGERVGLAQGHTAREWSAWLKGGRGAWRVGAQVTGMWHWKVFPPRRYSRVALSNEGVPVVSFSVTFLPEKSVSHTDPRGIKLCWLCNLFHVYFSQSYHVSSICVSPLETQSMSAPSSTVFQIRCLHIRCAFSKSNLCTDCDCVNTVHTLLKIRHGQGGGDGETSIIVSHCKKMKHHEMLTP